MPKMLPPLVVVVLGVTLFACSSNNDDMPQPVKTPTIWDKLAGNYTGAGLCIWEHNGEIDTTIYNAKTITVDSITPSELFVPFPTALGRMLGDSAENATSAMPKYVYYGSNGKFAYAVLDTLTLQMHWEDGGGFGFNKNKCTFDLVHD